MKKMPLKIMLLDDDFDFLRAANDFLSSAGHETRLFSKPAEAWEQFAKIKPDCLVLDLNMPLLDGREFLPWARKTFPEIIIVICTGMEIHDRAVFEENNVYAILQKPVTSATLIRTLENAAFEKNRK